MNSNVRKRSKNAKTLSDNRKERSSSGRTSKGKRGLSSLVGLIRSLLKWLSIVLILIVIIVFIISPIVFRYSLTIRRLLVFMNYVNYPLFKNLSDPKEEFGLNCTRNLYLTNEDNDQSIRLGVWHLLPKSRTQDCLKYNHSIDPLLAFDDNRPVFLYLHGNGGARGGHHRRQLYEVLTKSSQLDAHVVTFDYRGYGDSTNVWPTADGLRSDSNAVYQWLISQKHINKKRVIVWGHSLGTAVAVRFVTSLPKADNPRALVLEAPFTVISEAIQWHPFAVLYRKYFPYFETYFVEPVVENKVTNFDSISLLKRMSIPLLILHSQDDGIVPFHLGHKLYETSLKDQPKDCKMKAQMIAFNGEYGYGHKNIFKDSELPKIIQTFIDSSE